MPPRSALSIDDANDVNKILQSIKKHIDASLPQKSMSAGEREDECHDDSLARDAEAQPLLSPQEIQDHFHHLESLLLPGSLRSQLETLKETLLSADRRPREYLVVRLKELAILEKLKEKTKNEKLLARIDRRYRFLIDDVEQFLLALYDGKLHERQKPIEADDVAEESVANPMRAHLIADDHGVVDDVVAIDTDQDDSNPYDDMERGIPDEPALSFHDAFSIYSNYLAIANPDSWRYTGIFTALMHVGAVYVTYVMTDNIDTNKQVQESLNEINYPVERLQTTSIYKVALVQFFLVLVYYGIIPYSDWLLTQLITNTLGHCIEGQRLKEMIWLFKKRVMPLAHASAGVGSFLAGCYTCFKYFVPALGDMAKLQSTNEDVSCSPSLWDQIRSVFDPSINKDCMGTYLTSCLSMFATMWVPTLLKGYHTPQAVVSTIGLLRLVIDRLIDYFEDKELSEEEQSCFVACLQSISGCLNSVTNCIGQVGACISDAILSCLRNVAVCIMMCFCCFDNGRTVNSLLSISSFFDAIKECFSGCFGVLGDCLSSCFDWLKQAASDIKDKATSFVETLSKIFKAIYHYGKGPMLRLLIPAFMLLIRNFIYYGAKLQPELNEGLCDRPMSWFMSFFGVLFEKQYCSPSTIYTGLVGMMLKFETLGFYPTLGLFIVIALGFGAARTWWYGSDVSEEQQQDGFYMEQLKKAINLCKPLMAIGALLFGGIASVNLATTLYATQISFSDIWPALKGMFVNDPNIDLDKFKVVLSAIDAPIVYGFLYTLLTLGSSYLGFCIKDMIKQVYEACKRGCCDSQEGAESVVYQLIVDRLVDQQTADGYAAEQIQIEIHSNAPLSDDSLDSDSGEAYDNLLRPAPSLTDRVWGGIVNFFHGNDEVRAPSTDNALDMMDAMERDPVSAASIEMSRFSMNMAAAAAL